MKTKSFRKVLTTSATCIVLATSFAGGTLRVWAEQLYYGWNDGTRQSSPYFLYVSPKNAPKRELKDEYVVYCFNKKLYWPDQWESIYSNFNDIRSPYNDLPVYEKKLGYDGIFKQYAPDYKKDISDIASALVAVLSNGYPTNKSQLSTSYHLNNDSSRKVTQLAIWYFSDSLTKEYLKDTGGYNLNDMEKKALDFLISKGEDSKLKSEQSNYSLDIYVYQSGGHDHMKDYQNLLGSTLIPKEPLKPQLGGFSGHNGNGLSGLEGGSSGSQETNEDGKKGLIGFHGGLSGSEGKRDPFQD
ncbi:TPA: thioester-forming surface-anchored protein [Streptococcus equi subsp. equi]|uniref:Fibronectin-binding protein n=1 Tax=Streptococcus equi subsp. equi TaxID=148942 RepID=Q93ED6_9STRE|nr:thioester-forming surface-anchored protein [Streptococcus equi]AAL09480.1 fibronectin-binding protein [Streptococcus equi subsp. equi]ASB96011.1 putative collagen and fibronectin-binding cell surface-anchored protein FneE [Streptococcus equi subsp. equi]MBT1195261.1 thioester-forming surface-anchored protein [Streptococcus equi subsp. equi]MBT1198000.1 thioester-forming surface-anchored protein [Streptococcus equi subsp. equi]MBT1198357.1 thioester-forming surface-anchored protein [Streptoc